MMFPGVRPEHLLGFPADGLDLAGLLIDGDDRRLADDDAAALQYTKRVRRSQIDGEIVRETDKKDDGDKDMKASPGASQAAPLSEIANLVAGNEEKQRKRRDDSSRDRRRPGA